MRKVQLAPSVFGADIVNLKEELKIMEQNNVDLLHVDVMDGAFVNRIAFGSDHIRMLKKHTNIPLDVHMMIERPERYIDSFIDAGADIISIHQESTVMLEHCLQVIKNKGRLAGVVLSPATTPECLRYIMNLVDMVLIMTVNPGEGKQTFMKSMLPKIREVKEMIQDKNIDIEVDGSIDEETAAICLSAGANIFVSGGYIFTDTEKNISILQKILNIPKKHI
ncbi:ribulose-phosphate 3-epimerase [Pectinatus haikarae]|uniref:Ribulose-phosphate 3-epimerase n=1 Tax=Pectinatus haikarae TaxID=349096 RepID=A0ABT9YBT5_9FIRM|nr:ribulose-phosphate 3-epimerase [Pectinatus haikarae]MDQ0205093.1 ribulose-phosphate 3-epimerase [Pectinatus haikarae]